MIQKIMEDGLPVGIMEPQVFLKSNIRCNESVVVDYVKSVFNRYAKEPDSLIMFLHNTGWLLVVIILKWNKVLFLDSDRSKQRGHSLLK